MVGLTRGRVVPVLAALAGAAAGGCSGEDETARPPAATTTTTAASTEAVTETRDRAEATSAAEPLRFRGPGDRTLPPLRIPPGGTTLRWTNRDAVFSLFDGRGTIVDSVEPRGTASLPAGVHELEVIASGAWALEIPQGRTVDEP